MTKEDVLFLKAAAKSLEFFVVMALKAKPSEQQLRVIRAIDKGKRHISIRSGHGCFAKGHPVMMFDGSVKPVEKVRVGDLLMGDDGRTPRTVLELKRGQEEMYRFTFNSGDVHTYNASHKLVLAGMRGTVEVEVKHWLEWPADMAQKFHPYKRYPDGRIEPLRIATVEALGVGDYYGFTLNGNHRFLSGDFIVTRNTGKTTLLSWIVLWWGSFRDDVKIPMTAPTSHQLYDLLLPEVRKWWEKLPDVLKNSVEIKTEKIDFPQGFAVARTARKEQPEALQGFHATNLAFIIDEASGIPQIIFEVAEGAMTGEETLVIMAANPTRTEGYFYDSHHKNRWMWSCFQFNAEESENVSRDWIEQKKRQYGLDSDVYKVRVKGEFPSQSSNAVFKLAEIEDAIAREVYDDSGAEVWALDVADYGDDRSVLVKRKGKHFYFIEARRGLNLPELVGWLIYEYKKAKRKPAVIYYDAIGVGSSLGAVAYEKGLECLRGVKASNTATDYKTYENKRAEWYYTLSEIIADGKLPDDDELLGELMANKYKISTTGKLQLIDKKEIKNELGRSPDKADALAMCCESFSALDVLAAEEEIGDGIDETEEMYGCAAW